MFGEGYNPVPKSLFLALGTLVLGPLTTLAQGIMVVRERGERWMMNQMIDLMNQMVVDLKSHNLNDWRTD